jgi:hypothetical protein
MEEVSYETIEWRTIENCPGGWRDHSDKVLGTAVCE